MSAIQTISERDQNIEKAREVGAIALDYVSKAASNLVGSASEKAESIPLNEMSRRLDIALHVLRGEEVPAAIAPTTVQKTPLEVAREMLSSYTYDRETQVSRFTIPAGVTDIDAIKAINEYFLKYHPLFKREAISSKGFPLYEDENLRQRDASIARDVTITAIVQGTLEKNRFVQEQVLKDSNLVFADLRDQAIAAGLHAILNGGDDLFKGNSARSSVFGRTMTGHRNWGVIVSKDEASGFEGRNYHGASGSPKPEVK